MHPVVSFGKRPSHIALAVIVAVFLLFHVAANWSPVLFFGVCSRPGSYKTDTATTDNCLECPVRLSSPLLALPTALIGWDMHWTTES